MDRAPNDTRRVVDTHFNRRHRFLVASAHVQDLFIRAKDLLERQNICADAPIPDEKTPSPELCHLLTRLHACAVGQAATPRLHLPSAMTLSERLERSEQRCCRRQVLDIVHIGNEPELPQAINSLMQRGTKLFITSDTSSSVAVKR